MFQIIIQTDNVAEFGKFRVLQGVGRVSFSISVFYIGRNGSLALSVRCIGCLQGLQNRAFFLNI